MGTALTKEEKVQRLKELVQEYTQHLQLWGKSKVEEVIRTEFKIPFFETKLDKYGNKEEVLKHHVVKVEPYICIIITYYEPKGVWKEKLHPTAYESKEFPIEDIDARITHYKYKLKSLIK